MTNLETVLEGLKTVEPTLLQYREIGHYLKTGDAAGLARIRPPKKPFDSLAVFLGIAEGLAPIGAMNDENRRELHVLAAIGFLTALELWLDKMLEKEKEGEDIHGLLRVSLQALTNPNKRVLKLTAGHLRKFAREGKPTSAGRYLLGLSKDDLESALQIGIPTSGKGERPNLELVDFLVEALPEQVARHFDERVRNVRARSFLTPSIADILVKKGGRRFLKYRPVALDEARRALSGEPRTNHHWELIREMIQKFGTDVVPDMIAYLKRKTISYYQSHAVQTSAKELGKSSLPVLLAAMQSGNSDLRRVALPYLVEFDDGANDELIQREIQQGFSAKPPSLAEWHVDLAARWKIPLLAESMWPLLNHNSNPVRCKAARALAKLGDVAVPRAAELARAPKSEVRRAAVTLLVTLNTPKALEVLEKRLDLEMDDDVRDAILLGLEAAWAARGRKITKKEIEARIVKTAEKLKDLPANWIKEALLPALRYRRGGPLGKQAVRYLLYRQSRAREIRPDVEAKPFFDLIDRTKSADFAFEILKGFLATKHEAADRWALTIAGLLGDDRIVPILNRQIRVWADSNRGKMAEWAVQALGLLGTDAALLVLDSLAIRYRTKYANIGKAAVAAFAASAERLGVTPDELADRVVPWLGFEPGKPRIVPCGQRKLEVRMGLDFKLKFIDLEKNKPVASLPESAPKDVRESLKETGTTLREVSKAQAMRLENLMVRQYRWTADRWKKLFLAYPILFPFAVRLIWGSYSSDGRLAGTFRALEDRTLTTAADEHFDLPSGNLVGAVHPLELDERLRAQWLSHLGDYEIQPPFPQLDRPVVRLTAGAEQTKVLKDYNKTSLNAMTFKGRAERLGWTRGSVVDAGAIFSYYKSFPAAGVDAFLSIDGMYIGIDMYSDIELGDVAFVRSGSVKIGSYEYDGPGDENDNRVVPFGEVPAIVYSEVMGDLQRIAGKKADKDDES
jgi:hypothetical protein